MFEQLVNEAASRLNLPASRVSVLVSSLLSLMTSERRGGIEGFLDLFRRAGFGDIFTSWFSGNESKAITPAQLESALGTRTLDELASSSGLTRGSAGSALAFVLPKLIGRLTPGGVLPSTSAVLSQIPSHVEPASAAKRNVDRVGSPSWLPRLAAAALLVLGGWLWIRGPAGTIEPQLILHNRDGKITYSGVVRDESTRREIVNALNAAFSATDVSGDLRVDRNVRPASWLPRLSDLLAELKSPGVDLALNGNTINIGGWLSAAGREALTNRLHSLFGAQTVIGSLGDAATDAARTANDQAVSALVALGTSGVTPTSLVQAMNLSVINFTTGSSEIPADSMDVIRKSAEALKATPAGATIEIGGHTDNTGDPASNFSLSQARADAVKNALVAAGAPGAVLTTKGYGDSRPRASNDTEYGRFQNRRIEYSIAQ